MLVAVLLSGGWLSELLVSLQSLKMTEKNVATYKAAFPAPSLIKRILRRDECYYSALRGSCMLHNETCHKASLWKKIQRWVCNNNFTVFKMISSRGQFDNWLMTQFSPCKLKQDRLSIEICWWAEHHLGYMNVLWLLSFWSLLFSTVEWMWPCG